MVRYPNNNNSIYNISSPSTLLWNNLEELVEDFFVDGRISHLATGDSFPKLNMYKQDNKYIVEAGVAGWNIDDIEVKIDKQYLIFSSKTKEEKEINEKQFFLREMKNSSFQRKVLLGDRLNTKDPEISYTDGVIKVTFTEDEEKRPKILKIK
jgi:HSP20 family molecular chaperone IbpA